MVVDATFGHRIDPSERKAFDEAVAHAELVSPPAGAVGRGDAFLLRVAERVGAQVLSNDSFQEFHAEHPWLFDEGRLIGGKPVPGVGWIFTPRSPVRGVRSRAAWPAGSQGGPGRQELRLPRRHQEDAAGRGTPDRRQPPRHRRGRGRRRRRRRGGQDADKASQGARRRRRRQRQPRPPKPAKPTRRPRPTRRQSRQGGESRQDGEGRQGREEREDQEGGEGRQNSQGRQVRAHRAKAAKKTKKAAEPAPAPAKAQSRQGDRRRRKPLQECVARSGGPRRRRHDSGRSRRAVGDVPPRPTCAPPSTWPRSRRSIPMPTPKPPSPAGAAAGAVARRGQRPPDVPDLRLRAPHRLHGRGSGVLVRVPRRHGRRRRDAVLRAAGRPRRRRRRAGPAKSSSAANNGQFVLVALDPARRGAELALPESPRNASPADVPTAHPPLPQ